MTKKIAGLKELIDADLRKNILPFWRERSVDYDNGGFHGRILNDMTVDNDSHKGLILNTRILWTFSSVYIHFAEEKDLELAFRAFEYLTDQFIDKEFGGAYWSVDKNGLPVDDSKKIYGQAFTIYALSEYYLAAKNERALELAKEIFNLIENKSYDSLNGGYFESFNRDWTLAADLRLSAVDMNEKKSMNTHLHVLEAYTNLYRVWKDEKLESRLRELLRIFKDHIIDSDTNHFKLFFDEEWNSKKNALSFGHDIEGSWLLLEAAEILGDMEIENEFKELAIRIAEVTLKEGIDNDGGIFYEGVPGGKWDREKHWWPQAEGIVGFLNAYEISGNRSFFEAADGCWNFLDRNLIDEIGKEWFYGLDDNGNIDLNKARISEWKGPYHNTRSCLEAVTRLERMLEN